MFPVKRTGWVFCLYVTPWLCVNVFCAGSFAGDVLRLLADGLGTTFVNNRHDNQARRKGTGQCSSCRFLHKKIISDFARDTNAFVQVSTG